MESDCSRIYKIYHFLLQDGIALIITLSKLQYNNVVLSFVFFKPFQLLSISCSQNFHFSFVCSTCLNSLIVSPISFTRSSTSLFPFLSLLISWLWVSRSCCMALLFHSLFLTCARIWSGFYSSLGTPVFSCIPFTTSSTIRLNRRSQQTTSPSVSCDAVTFGLLARNEPILSCISPTGNCKCGNKLLGSIKGGKFFN